MNDPLKMTAGELKNWLRDRLQMNSLAIADLDRRNDEAAYELPLKLWKDSVGEYHFEFLRSVVALIEESIDSSWEPDSFTQLCLLVEAGKIWEARTPLENIARSKRLQLSKDGDQLQMLALRTLLALGWTGNWDFWRAQQELLGARWPGIIFKGFVRQDLMKAFDALPSLAIDANAVRQILGVLPAIIREQKVTVMDLRKLIQNSLPSLVPVAKEMLSQWFELRGYPLATAIESSNPGLTAALRRVLGPAAEPLTKYARLVKHAEFELAA